MCARTPFSMLPYGSVTPHFPTLVEKRLRISFVQIILPAHTKNRPRVDSFHLLPNFGRKIETLAFSSIIKHLDAF